MPPKKVSVRLMVPFSMQCDACHSYIYKSTKFNARKTPTKDSYLGIAIVQFQFRCSSCSAPITFRTDPQSRGYKLVSGAHELVAPTTSTIAPPPDNAEPSTREEIVPREIPRRVCKLPKPKPRKHLLKPL